MRRPLRYLLVLAFMVGCSSQQQFIPHNPTNILILADGRFVLGSYSKKHEPSSLVKDLTQEGIGVDRKLIIRGEPGTSKESIDAVVAELRKAGYRKISLED